MTVQILSVPAHLRPARPAPAAPGGRDKLAALDDLHQPDGAACAGCGQTWPCASRRILTGGTR